MESILNVLKIVAPIFATIGLGILARKKNTLSEEQIRGLQQFVMSFCLPCVVFNSCLSASFGMESLATMGLVMPMILLSSVWSFRQGKKIFPYHNMPMLFSAQESGMLGIPLFMTLFGAANVYRMGVLDLAQSVVAIPVIAILSADAGNNPSPGAIFKKVIQSPLLRMSFLGLLLNLTGAMDVLNRVGVGGIVTEITGFLAQPVSAVILFCVGYNFSLGSQNRKDVFRICGLHFVLLAVFCLIIQGILCFVPSTDAMTRWAVLLYCALPGSYLSASLGKTREDNSMAASVCSVLTVVCLAIFCVITVLVT